MSNPIFIKQEASYTNEFFGSKKQTAPLMEQVALFVLLFRQGIVFMIPSFYN